MTKALLLIFALASSCSKPEEPMDTREPIAILYVGGTEAAVHVRPDDKSRVLTRYQHSESVPVLARKGDWAEVRTAMGTGWVHQSDLVSAEEGAQSKSDPTPRFEHAPSPVTAPGVHGTVYIKANVNTDGDVIATQIITDTTNAPGLAARNAAALQRSKFRPIVIRGERKPFEYYYRVDY